jgi:hypothetical protein
VNLGFLYGIGICVFVGGILKLQQRGVKAMVDLLQHTMEGVFALVCILT